MHERLAPQKHAFSYPLYVYSLDLDEIGTLARRIPFLSYNRRNIVSLRDADYLPGAEGTIKERLATWLQRFGREFTFSRVEIITSLRYFGYVFNPVNFYRCYDEDDTLQCAVAEVNNTFGETHLYILDDPLPATTQKWQRYRCAKDFHVSPFNDMKGDYEFLFAQKSDELDIRINIIKDNETVFLSRLSGQAKPLDTRSLSQTLFTYPLAALSTMGRILWEAGKLYTVKKMQVFTKPVAHSAMTINTAKPTLTQRFAMTLILKWFGRMKTGRVELRMPHGEPHIFGDPAAPAITMHIRDYRFFTRCLMGGDIGFGEAYTEGDWDTSDLTALLRVFVQNMEDVEKDTGTYAFLGEMVNRLSHLARRNSRSNSRKNISAHYDLSNNFFELLLDPTMTYSCARFGDDAPTLELAQKKKLRGLINKARIGRDHHVLEIGSGWGSMAIEAVRQTGCRVTTITLSIEQKKLAEKRIRDAGLEDRIEVVYSDYRDMKGKFDRIISVEMLEAVGHEYLGTFFNTCDRLLNPNGLAVIQVITIPDRRYEVYRRSSDWIQKYIFPGGICPSLSAMTEAMSRSSEFVVEHLENIGVDYARTLAEWRQRFHNNIHKTRELGFDERFERIWNYYLCYCEAGFATRNIGTVQMVLTRPNNLELPTSHGYA